MDENEKHLKLLHRYLDEEQKEIGRDHMTKIWHDDGYSYSTNGFVLIRVPGKYGADCKEGKYPKTNIFDWEVLESAKEFSEISLIELKRVRLKNKCTYCNSKLNKNKRIECQECHCAGEVECDKCGDGMIECKLCEGTGWQWEIATKNCPECFGSRIGSHHITYRIDGILFNPAMIYCLNVNLPNFRLYTEKSIANGCCGFKFGDNGTGAIMTLRENVGDESI
jgi:hypothetical protein